MGQKKWERGIGVKGTKHLYKESKKRISIEMNQGNKENTEKLCGILIINKE